MNFQNYFHRPAQAGLFLGAAALSTLTGCVAREEGPRGEIDAVPPVFVVQDDYVYYPG